jgi:hypothetical protein
MSDLEARVSASSRIRRERARLVGELRYADSATTAMSRCADLIERRPECLHAMDVHALIEACHGVGPEGADVIQEAAGMFRAYRLEELPHGIGCALVALLRLRTSHGTRVSSLPTVLTAAGRDATSSSTTTRPRIARAEGA